MKLGLTGKYFRTCPARVEGARAMRRFWPALQLALLVVLLVIGRTGEAAPPGLESLLPDPLEPLGKFLRDRGWTLLYVPSARFGPGSVITPDGQDLKLDASSCFPRLKVVAAQSAALPEIEKGNDYSAETGVAFLRGLLGSVTGLISGAVTAHVAFSELKHSAVDIKTLSDAYSASCDPFLKLLRNPVVISELLSGRPAVTFKKRDGGKIALTLEKIKQIFSAKGKVAFEVKDNVTLVTQDSLFFAYKAVRPVRQDGRIFFAAVTVDQLLPNYFAVWEHEISKYAVGRFPERQGMGCEQPGR
jgi:hypothetical protein